MKTTTTRMSALGIVVVMLFATPGLALAQEADQTRPMDAAVDEAPFSDRVTDGGDHPCGAVKERALHAIQNRLAVLSRLQDAVASSEHLTRPHKAELQAELASVERALTQKAEAIREASCRDLPELVRQLVDDHRIFALLLPKVHLVIGSDTLGHIIGQFERVAGRLQEVIARFEAEGYEVSAAQAELDEMKAQLVAAFGLAEPIPGMVLPLKPADLPGAASIIEEAARMLQGAGGETRAAWMSAHEVVKALSEIKNG